MQEKIDALEELVDVLMERLEDLERDMEEIMQARQKRRKYMRNYMRERRANEKRDGVSGGGDLPTQEPSRESHGE